MLSFLPGGIRVGHSILDALLESLLSLIKIQNFVGKPIEDLEIGEEAHVKSIKILSEKNKSIKIVSEIQHQNPQGVISIHCNDSTQSSPQ